MQVQITTEDMSFMMMVEVDHPLREEDLLIINMKGYVVDSPPIYMFTPDGKIGNVMQFVEEDPQAFDDIINITGQ